MVAIGPRGFRGRAGARAAQLSHNRRPSSPHCDHGAYRGAGAGRYFDVGELSDTMSLLGVLLIMGGVGLLAGVVMGVRRRLRADSRRPAEAGSAPRIGRSALLADTLPLQPVSSPGQVPWSRSV